MAIELRDARTFRCLQLAREMKKNNTVTEALVGYVTASMLSMGFKEHWIPDEEAPAKCPIYGTTNWHSAPRLLIVLINQVRVAHRHFLVQSVLLFAWFLSGRIGDYDVWGASEFLSMKLTHNFFYGTLFIFLLSFFTVATTTTTTTKWNSWAAFRRWEATGALESISVLLCGPQGRVYAGLPFARHRRRMRRASPKSEHQLGHAFGGRSGDAAAGAGGGGGGGGKQCR